MQQSAGSPWADTDVSHLLSTLAAGLRMGTPRINTFSGDATPGKTKVSFKQWYHEIQCVKYHYLQSVVQESIIRLLKGSAADMARYVGLTASIDHILWKLSVIFGTVAYFEVLMQNFSKVTQGNNGKVSFFAMRLEGTLNQIQLQCPRRMMAVEAQQHLKDCLFHRVHKHTHNSVWYLYSAPDTSYSQLMVAPRKVESENEETRGKVRARAMVTSDPGAGNAEHSQQIAKLMAALTQTGLGSSPSSTPGSPGNVATDRGKVVGAPPVTQTPAMAGLALVRQPQPTVFPQNGV